MAELADTAYVLPDSTIEDFADWENSDEYKALKALMDRSLRLPEGQVVDGLLRWQRGDGYAWYLVIDDDPLAVQWVQGGDNWQVEWPLIKGLDLEDVREMLRRQKAMHELFSGSEA